MKIKALKFIPDPPGKSPVRSTLDATRAQDFENTKRNDLPITYVVKREDLAVLLKFKDLILDRGKQHRDKELTRYFLNLREDKIPILEGKYKGPGTLTNAIKKLMERGLERGDSNLYFLGVEEILFDRIWEEADHSVSEADGLEEELKTDQSSKTYETFPADITEVTSSLIPKLVRKHGQPPKELAKKYVGDSEEAALVRHLIHAASKSESPVLILGETGTGKEIIARTIHENSNRKASRLAPVNCSSIPWDLLESELFGHVKGGFTGAIKDKMGLWADADNGTLFLDEIGDLRAEQQAKILRALSERKIRPVGATEDIPVNARIVAATNRDLFSMVQTDAFREDLYYRLGGLFIRTPALRDHRDDIPLLARHLWRKITKDGSIKIPPEIIEELQRHDWPGNVRQLKMILNGLYDMFGTEDLTVTDLRYVLYLTGERITPGERPVSPGDINMHLAECLRHLKRVHEVIHGSLHAIHPTMEQAKIDEQLVLSLQDTMRFRFYELEKLCQKPLLFHHESTFSAVNGLKGKITYLMGLLEKDRQEAQKYWNIEVAEAFSTVTSTIFKEIERVLAEA